MVRVSVPVLTGGEARACIAQKKGYDLDAYLPLAMVVAVTVMLSHFMLQLELASRYSEMPIQLE